MAVLALKYRPRTFADVVGQKTVRVVLQQMVKKNQLPPAMIFDGSRGTGKTTTARILSAALNCLAPREDASPCTECAICQSIFDGSCPDILEIDAASNGLVDDVRKIKEMSLYSNAACKWKVVLLDEAHSMSTAAFNALLKLLEEPPPNTLFILLTTEPSKILGTVLSRCMEFTFRRISTLDIVDRLKYIAKTEEFVVDEELLMVIAERANGGMRDAVMTFDQVTSVGVRNAEQFAKLMGESDVAPSIIGQLHSGQLSGALAAVDELLLRTGDAQTVSSDLVRVLRDCLVLQSNGEIHRQGAPLESRRALASAIGSDLILAGLRVLWDLKTKVRSSDDPRSSLDLAVIMLSEALQGHAMAKPNVNLQAPEKMTFEALAAATK